MREKRRARVDWPPLLPRLLVLVKEGKSARAICADLGVSHLALSSAIERSVPAKLRSEWKARWRKSNTPGKDTKPAPILRDALEAGSAVTWGAIWNGQAPAFPSEFNRGRLS